jgi:hypothetical protein
VQNRFQLGLMIGAYASEQVHTPEPDEQE